MGSDNSERSSLDVTTQHGELLLHRAEGRLESSVARVQVPRTAQETTRLVHELEIHQIELEMQNAELSQARDDVDTALLKYTDLYDFAPVGYLTLNRQGTVHAANLTIATFLGIERSRLIGGRFGLYIADGARQLFMEFLATVFFSSPKKACEVELKTEGAFSRYVQLEALVAEEEVCHVAVIDITLRKRVEEELQIAHEELELKVIERTGELARVNKQLTQEIDEHKTAKESLQGTLAEIVRLKDQLQAENLYLRQEVAREYNFGELIGQSPVLAYVFFRIEQVAPQDATVLLLGETGTGKGVVAGAIHRRSARKDRPMITVNCASLPANLIENELFGRERGAFTGAHERQIGRFELADGGTIFLDEIGELPPDLQCKLLRVVQSGEFERLGSPRTIKVNVRIIAATNRNLEEDIRSGRFREDLFYRLNVFPITIPPLRQRPEDIPLLVKHFLAKFNKKMGKKIEVVPKETQKALAEYRWPGNVRELESVIERAVITSQGNGLEVLDRFETFRREEPQEHEIKALADLEQHHILQVLQKTGWRIDGKSGAALLLGLNPSTLRARMRKLGIRRD
jgi:formate hydrogenlyase transcriptional activator